MSAVARGGASALPTALIAQAIPRLSRHDLEALAERLIDQLDRIDGDCDLEEDDPQGECSEDEINYRPARWTGYDSVWNGPGCPYSDTDY